MRAEGFSFDRCVRPGPRPGLGKRRNRNAFLGYHKRKVYGPFGVRDKGGLTAHLGLTFYWGFARGHGLAPSSLRSHLSKLRADLEVEAPGGNSPLSIQVARPESDVEHRRGNVRQALRTVLGTCLAPTWWELPP